MTDLDEYKTELEDFQSTIDVIDEFLQEQIQSGCFNEHLIHNNCEQQSFSMRLTEASDKICDIDAKIVEITEKIEDSERGGQTRSLMRGGPNMFI